MTTGIQSNANDITLSLNGSTVRKFGQGSNVASAATVDLNAINGDYGHITGTTTITALTLPVGDHKTVVFDGALTLTNGASLILPGGANILTSVGDSATFRGEAAGVVRCVSYNRAVINSMVRVNTANGYGSTNTKIRRFTNIVTNTGTDITYADSATLGASFTINTPGVYSISYNDQFSSASFFGLSLNTTAPTTSLFSIPIAEILVGATATTANQPENVSVSVYLAAGSIVRAHCDIVGSGTVTTGCQFTITRVG